MSRFVNLAYALLIEGRDEESRAELDAELDAPTPWELRQAQQYMNDGVKADVPVVAPAWFGDTSDTDAAWAEMAGMRRG